MQKIMFLFSVILVSGLTEVHSLQCYFCFNCTNPTDADLVTCGNPVTSPPPSTGSTGTTTDSPESTIATTDSSGTTDDSTFVTTDSSDISTSPGSGSTLGSDSEDSSPEETRAKRSILSPFSSNSDGCDCRNGENCECGDDLFSSRNSQYADDVPFVCFKVTIDNSIIERGCGPATWLDGKALCESEIAANLTSCSTCDTGKCNSSITIQYSSFMLVATISLMLFK